MGISKYLYIGAVITILLLGGSCWLLIERNGTLKGQLTIAEQANKEWTQKVQDIKKQINKETELRTDLATELQKTRKEADDYKSKFARHDLETLAKIKPGLIDRRIKSGTKRVLANLEAAINRSGHLPGQPDIRSSETTATSPDNSHN